MDTVSEVSPSITTHESVIPIPRELCHLDPEFPWVSVRAFSPLDIMAATAKQVVDTTVPLDAEFTSETTRFLGRGVFGKSGILIETTDGRRRVGGLFTKSTGVPLVVRNHWQSYHGQPAFFYYEPTESDLSGDTRMVLTDHPGFLGISTREDQVLDALRSKELHELGAKVRLPLAGWRVDSLAVQDKASGGMVRKTIEWFKKQGFTGDELYQSEWAMACPLRLEDVNAFLVDAVGEAQTDIAALDDFTRFSTALAKADRSPPYQTLYRKWGERMTNEKVLSKEECIEVLEDFGVALTQTMGANYNTLYKNGIKYGFLHPQNISYFGELCDNSSVSPGLLEISLGDRGDISGFDTAMKKYAEMIYLLKGRKRIDYNASHANDFNRYVSRTFFRPLREVWRTYNQFCQDRYKNDVDEYKNKKHAYLVESLESDAIPVTERTINFLARRKVRSQRPFMEMTSGGGKI